MESMPCCDITRVELMKYAIYSRTNARQYMNAGFVNKKFNYFDKNLSYCRSLFRSIINFVAHKRTICRTLQSSIRAEHFEAIVNEHDREGGNPVMKRNSKNMRTLRRFNPVSTLSKHIRSVKVRLQTANVYFFD